MNHTYRLVFNASAGVCQAVPEVASGSSGGQTGSPRRAGAASGSRVQARFLATAVTVAIALFAAPGSALSQSYSGAGGTSFSGKAGGVGVATTAGNAGAPDYTNMGGGGGSGGGIDPLSGYGKAGGDGGWGSGFSGGAAGGNVYYHLSSGTYVNAASGVGMSGASAIAAEGSTGGGGGGGGGAGAWVGDTATQFTNLGALVGGAGGTGGSTVGRSGGAGGGGAGGSGYVSSNSASLLNSGSGLILGGAGGRGGQGEVAGAAGRGGDGGVGVWMTAGGSFSNAAAAHVFGGAGGAGGTDSGGTAAGGAGGVGLMGANVTVLNQGVITGGLGADGVRALAVKFTGGTNVYEMQSGSQAVGGIDARLGTNTFRFSGANDSSIAAASFGTDYLGFSKFEKTGSSTLTLSGATSAATPWTVSQGALAVATDTALGATSGILTLDGGTLRATDSFTSSRNVALANQGYIDTNGNDVRLDGVIGLTALNSGALVKQGTGVLTITNANNTYNQGTYIERGTLAVSGDGKISDQLVNIVGGGYTAALDISQATSGVTIKALLGNGSVYLGNKNLTLGVAGGQSQFDGYTYWGGIAGGVAGKLIIVGDATSRITITGNLQHPGGTEVNAGTLALTGNGRLSSTSPLTLAANTTFDVTGITALQTDIGALSGAGRVVLGDRRLQVVSDGSDTTFSGDIAGNARLAFSGTGTQTIASAQSFTGDVQAYRGLKLTGTGSLANASSVLLAYRGQGDLDISGITAAGTSMRVLTGEGYIELGSKSLTLSGGATASDIAGVISGTGSLVSYSSAGVRLTGANTYSGGTDVQQGVLSIAGAGKLNTAGAVNLAAPATLDIASIYATGLQIGDLTGAGTVQLGAKDLTVGTSGNSTFSGVINGGGSLIKQGSGTFTLDAPGSYAGGTRVAAGTLALGANGLLPSGSAVAIDGGATLDLGTQSAMVGSISGEGRIIIGQAGRPFGVNSAGDSTFAGEITGAGYLRKLGTGTLTLSGANTYTGATVVEGGRLNLTGSLASTMLEVDGAATLDISGMTPAALNVQGLFQWGSIILGSKSLNVLGSNSIIAGAVSGDGGMNFSNPSTVMTAANTYTGGTHLNAGTLSLSGAGALAPTGAVSIDAPATFEISQINATGTRIGDLSGAGQVRLGGKTLTVGTAASTAFNGGIEGTGSLVKEGTGTLTLSGASTYQGGTALHAGRIDVASNAALGTGALAMDDGTTLGFAADGLVIGNALHFTGVADPTFDTGAFTATLAGAITGAADMTKTGTGTLVLASSNSFTGDTTVAQGTLRAGAANAFSPASAHTVAAGATLDTGGFSQTIAGLANSGTVSLVGAAAGSTLTVTGPYVGTSGVLKLGTTLGNDASVSDKLVLSGAGASVSGNTTVQITNIGGLGAATPGNGIEVISAVNGATSSAQSAQKGFALANGHVDAGAFEYRLYAGDAAGAGENWYLRNTVPVTPPVDPVVPVAPPVTPPLDPATPAEPGTPTAPSVPATPTSPATVVAYRPVVALFSALPEQLRQGNLAMLGNLHQRMGDDDVKLDDGSRTDRRAWGRVLSTDLRISQQGTVSPDSSGQLTGWQAGTDLLNGSTWRAGVYVGQLDGDMQVSGFASGVQHLGVGHNDLKNQYLGVYGTWAEDGLYVDAVLQGGRHTYDVDPVANIGTSGKGNSLLASVEVGQSFAIARNWFVEPQLQVASQHLNLDNQLIAGSLVQQDTANTWMIRAGVRVKGEFLTGIGRLQPYARVNVYNTSSGTADYANFVAPGGTAAVATRTGGTSTELASGLTWAVDGRTNVYGEVGKTWASGGDSRVSTSVQGSLGVRIKW